MHIIYRQYQIKPNSGGQLIQKIREGFIPKVNTVNGFVSYNAFINDGGDLCSVGIFRDKEGAETSNALAKEFLTRENLSSLMLGAPDVSQGEIGVSA